MELLELLFGAAVCGMAQVKRVVHACSKEFPGTVPGGNCLPASCTYGASTPTQCIDGFASVFVTATYSPGSCSEQGITEQECKSAEGQQAILCGQPSVALGFFNYQQFILSIIAIAGIYFLMYRRRA